jgi:hypothetical protein
MKRGKIKERKSARIRKRRREERRKEKEKSEQAIRAQYSYRKNFFLPYYMNFMKCS